MSRVLVVTLALAGACSGPQSAASNIPRSASEPERDWKQLCKNESAEAQQSSVIAGGGVPGTSFSYCLLTDPDNCNSDANPGCASEVGTHFTLALYRVGHDAWVKLAEEEVEGLGEKKRSVIVSPLALGPKKFGVAVVVKEGDQVSTTWLEPVEQAGEYRLQPVYYAEGICEIKTLASTTEGYFDLDHTCKHTPTTRFTWSNTHQQLAPSGAAESAPEARTPARDACMDEVSCVVANNPPACCKKYSRQPPPDWGTRPQRPSRSDVLRAMRSVRHKVSACTKHGGKGLVKIKVKVKVLPQGRVAMATATSAASVAVRKCVAKAVKTARFPRSQQGLTLVFPFKLR